MTGVPLTPLFTRSTTRAGWAAQPPVRLRGPLRRPGAPPARGGRRRRLDAARRAAGAARRPGAGRSCRTGGCSSSGGSPSRVPRSVLRPSCCVPRPPVAVRRPRSAPSDRCADQRLADLAQRVLLLGAQHVEQVGARTASTWPGAASSSAAMPSSVSSANCPRRSSAQDRLRTQPRLLQPGDGVRQPAARRQRRRRRAGSSAASGPGPRTAAPGSRSRRAAARPRAGAGARAGRTAGGWR